MTLSLAACNRAEPAKETADLVIRGGPVYTGVDAAPRAEAVGVKDGAIIYVGDAAGADALVGAGTQVVDLKGAALYPGFTDAHAHLLGIGMRELTLNLEGVGSIDELVDIVAAEVGESEDGAVIYGRGWIETGWPEARFPTRDDLDPVSPSNPVVLYRADGHALVANSAALAAAGVDETTPDPEGGRVEKDAAGRPTGMFIDRAMGLLASLQAAPTDEQKAEAYKVGAGVYAAYGWTGVHNMSVNPDDLPIIERLAGTGDVPIRVYNAIDGDGFDWLVESPGGAASKNGAGDDAVIESAGRTDETGRIITRAIKLYADGSLGSRGAALAEPYADQPDTSGLLLMQPEEAKAIMARALKAGVQVSTHAIGDRGNKLVLDWYEEVFAAQGDNWRSLPSPRWRIEHAQVVAKADIPRFAALGVIASMQPSHAIGDLYFAPARLGPARLDGAYAWRSLLDAGAVIAAGSDA
ncbi:MAG: amidohydrolase, partial [Parvularculaceae bacterium]